MHEIKPVALMVSDQGEKMKFRNQFLKYKTHFKEGEGEGGGGGGDDDKDATIADLQTQLKKVLDKNEELLGETKTAKKAKTEAEAAATEKAQQALKEAGDFKSLYESSEKARVELEESFTGLKGNIAAEKIKGEAMKIATGLADGPNAELLSDYISKRLKHTDEGLKVTDASGNLTISTVEELTREFQSDTRFSALLRGNQSSGGGANGGDKKGGGAANGDNPWSKDNFNLTKQGEITKNDPDLAAQLKTAAKG